MELVILFYHGFRFFYKLPKKSIMKPLICFFLIIVIFTSCEKNPSDKKAPEIPPVETLFIDLSEMEDVNKSAEITKTNWIYSATTVTVWNITVWSAFAVPTAAFKNAFNNQPTVINDVTWTWQWEYAVEGFNSEYTARLVGTLETASSVSWEMYISKSGDNAFEDFLWFEGTSDTDGKSGQWILYYSPQFQDKMVQVDWKIEGEEVWEVMYTYVRKINNLGVSDKFYGSTLTYGLQENVFDAFLHIHAYNYQAADFKDTEIEWNRSDYSGHIKDEYFYGDTEWHCWDKDQNDIVCN